MSWIVYLVLGIMMLGVGLLLIAAFLESQEVLDESVGTEEQDTWWSLWNDKSQDQDPS